MANLTLANDGMYDLRLTEDQLIVISRLLISVLPGDDRFTQAAWSLLGTIEENHNEFLDESAGLCYYFTQVRSQEGEVAATMDGDLLEIVLNDIEQVVP